MSPGVRRQWLPAHSETKHRRMLERSLLRVGDPSWDQGRLRQDSDKNAFSSCPPMMWEHPWPGTYWLLVSAASRPRISSHSSHPVSCPFASQATPGTKRTEGAWGSKAPKLLISSHLVPAWEDGVGLFLCLLRPHSLSMGSGSHRHVQRLARDQCLPVLTDSKEGREQAWETLACVTYPIHTDVSLLPVTF
jgi:hypothetical protein